MSPQTPDIPDPGRPGNDNPGQLAVELFTSAFWLPAMVFAVYVCACILGVTTRLPRIDMVFHLVGGFSIGFCVDRGLGILESRGWAGGPEGVLRAAFILSMTASAALLWEFAEFAVDSLYSMRFQTDLADTMSDLALGVVGGIVFLLLHRFMRGRRKVS